MGDVPILLLRLSCRNFVYIVLDCVAFIFPCQQLLIFAKD